jgi:hypothetical protein
MPTIPNFPDALNDEHHAWRQPAAHPWAPTRQIQLPNPGSGLEVVTSHRDFIAKFSCLLLRQGWARRVDHVMSQAHYGDVAPNYEAT